MKATRLPGFVGYATIALWFLLTVLTPLSARAEEQRQSTIVISDLTPAIEAALMQNGVAPEAEVTLDAPQTLITLQNGAAPIFDSISVNPITGRFLIRARGHTNTASVAISGRAALRTRFPVLTRAILRNELIEEQDITYIERNDLPGVSFVTDAAELIGKIAQRPLKAHAPLRKTSVKSPELVKKGALVTMRYVSDGLQLSHHGVARQSGTLGDVITIINTDSDRSIKAVITGTNSARVISVRQSLKRG